MFTKLLIKQLFVSLDVSETIMFYVETCVLLYVIKEKQTFRRSFSKFRRSDTAPSCSANHSATLVPAPHDGERPPTNTSGLVHAWEGPVPLLPGKTSLLSRRGFKLCSRLASASTNERIMVELELVEELEVRGSDSTGTEHLGLLVREVGVGNIVEELYPLGQGNYGTVSI